MGNKITIGIGARNEECATICSTLRSIRVAVKFVIGKEFNIVVCLNGNYDKALLEVNKYKEEYGDIKVHIIYNSEEGIISTQRKIIESYPADIYVFLDGDTIVKKDALYFLLSEFDRDNKVWVAYGRTKPLGVRSKSFFERINVLYNNQKFLTKRYYFHGRLFAIRDWYFPDKTNYRKNNNLLNRFGYFLSLDDVYLSFYTLDKYGPDSIKEVKESICYAWPISNFKDWYKTYRRTKIELIKVSLLYPEYRYLLKRTKRKTQWDKLLQADSDEIILWSFFLVLRFIYNIIFDMELLFISLKIYKPTIQWETVWSTKKEI